LNGLINTHAWRHSKKRFYPVGGSAAGQVRALRVRKVKNRNYRMRSTQYQK
jgi:hypothetical protein